MTWLLFLLGAVAAVCVFVAGYLAGLRSRDLEASSYWQGFADGELHTLLTERAPSPN